MRWLACVVLLAGCLRARATVVHPTGVDRTSSGTGGTTIARTASPASDVPQPPEVNPNLVSVELGALIPFTDTSNDSVRVHLAPGLRIFGSQQILWGVSVGADLLGNRRHTGFALEGSVYAGDSSSDPTVIEQAVDIFAGVAVRRSRSPTSLAIGPSLGVLGLPGGHSVVMLGIGLRVTGGPDH